MGLDAEVIAIGRFNREISDSLNYPAEFYSGTRDGVIVISTVFQAITTDMSYELAEYFGVHPWDFNSHELDPALADVEKLSKSDFSEELPKFLKLRDAGFKFYYLPNG